MNYFSHFCVDYQLGNNEFNTGLILPDVTRDFVKSFDIPIPENNIYQTYKSGCLAHYRADKLFHASDFFNGLLLHANKLMNGASFTDDLNRKWFLAHILTEVMLDRLLVKEYPDLLNAFYQSLSNINDTECKSFLSLFTNAILDEFFNGFNHFRNVQYIYYYPDNIKFVYSLNRIMIKAGVGAMSEYNQQVLLQVALQMEIHIMATHPNLLHSLIQCTHE